MTLSSSPWFIPMPLRASARLRLFCFPYAGGGSATFRRWRELVPDVIELVAIQLPGRETRFDEPPLRDMNELVEQLADAITPHLDRPYATFGHSLGTLVSYELVLALQRRKLPLPRRMLMSGRGAPHVMRGGKDCDLLSDAEFVDELRQMQGTPEEILANGELMQMLLPALRADFSLARNYQREEPAFLPCGLSVYGGLSDSGVSRVALEEWQSYTEEGITLRMFPGGHFFVDSASHLLLHALVRDLYPFATSPARAGGV